jgi:hypothetical protein
MIHRVLGLFVLLSLSGCQTNPTLVNQEIRSSAITKDFKGLLKPNTVIFDTRSTFDFNLHRVAGSISLPPQDFKVSVDPLSAARRLSLWGVTPETPVVVIGVNLESITSLAWELALVGVQNIETYSLEKLRTLNVFPEQARTNVALWTHSENYQVYSVDEIKKISKDQFKKFDKALILQVGESRIPEKFKNFPIIKWVDNYAFNSAFFLVSQQKFNDEKILNRPIILVDSSQSASTRAYVAFKSGIKKLTLIK